MARFTSVVRAATGGAQGVLRGAACFLGVLVVFQVLGPGDTPARTWAASHEPSSALQHGRPHPRRRSVFPPIVTSLIFVAAPFASPAPSWAARIVKDKDKYVFDAASGRRVKPSCLAVCLRECEAIAGPQNMVYCNETCAGECAAEAEGKPIQEVRPETDPTGWGGRVAMDSEKNAFERFAEAAAEFQADVFDKALLSPGRGSYRDIQPDSLRALEN